MELIIEYVGWYPWPYIKYARLSNAQADYYGHGWYIAFHCLWWEMMLVRIVKESEV